MVRLPQRARELPRDKQATRADGNFAGFGTGAGFFQRDLHEFRIVIIA